MATAMLIEEESGTYTGRYHPHNGYYAGDFSRRPAPAATIHSIAPIVAIPGLSIENISPAYRAA
jgi:hypothetical protein